MTACCNAVAWSRRGDSHLFGIALVLRIAVVVLKAFVQREPQGIHRMQTSTALVHLLQQVLHAGAWRYEARCQRLVRMQLDAAEEENQSAPALSIPLHCSVFLNTEEEFGLHAVGSEAIKIPCGGSVDTMATAARTGEKSELTKLLKDGLLNQAVGRGKPSIYRELENYMQTLDARYLVLHSVHLTHVVLTSPRRDPRGRDRCRWQ